MADVIKVLSIDGGGIRAIIPALILDYIEQQTGKRTSDMFDLIAGTSSGGIVALGLVHPGLDGSDGYSARELADLFLENGDDIFSPPSLPGVGALSALGTLRQVLDEKHNHRPLEGVLKRYYGEATLADVKKPVIVPSYDVESASPRFFVSRREADGLIPMWKVARATTAAPTFFEAFRLDVDGRTEALIDGGMIANNPGMVALTEVTHHIEDYAHEGNNLLDTELLMVSLGTGRLRTYFKFDEIKDRGALEWARPAIEIAITGGVETVHHQLAEVLRHATGRYYYRFQVDVPDANRAMDDATSGNLKVVEELADKMLNEYRAALDELIEKLVD